MSPGHWISVAYSAVLLFLFGYLLFRGIRYAFVWLLATSTLCQLVVAAVVLVTSQGVLLPEWLFESARMMPVLTLILNVAGFVSLAVFMLRRHGRTA